MKLSILYFLMLTALTGLYGDDSMKDKTDSELYARTRQLNENITKLEKKLWDMKNEKQSIRNQLGRKWYVEHIRATGVKLAKSKNKTARMVAATLTTLADEKDAEKLCKSLFIDSRETTNSFDATFINVSNDEARVKIKWGMYGVLIEIDSGSSAKISDLFKQFSGSDRSHEIPDKVWFYFDDDGYLVDYQTIHGSSIHGPFFPKLNEVQKEAKRQLIKIINSVFTKPKINISTLKRHY